MPTKNKFFPKAFLLITFWRYIFVPFSLLRFTVKKRSQNQGFSTLLCLLMEIREAQKHSDPDPLSARLTVSWRAFSLFLFFISVSREYDHFVAWVSTHFPYRFPFNRREFAYAGNTSRVSQCLISVLRNVRDCTAGIIIFKVGVAFRERMEWKVRSGSELKYAGSTILAGKIWANIPTISSFGFRT
jgi:hypothetical protein